MDRHSWSDAGILDCDEDVEVDLASFAYQIWKNPIDRDPAIQKVMMGMRNPVFLGKSTLLDQRAPLKVFSHLYCSSPLCNPGEGDSSRSSFPSSSLLTNRMPTPLVRGELYDEPSM